MIFCRLASSAPTDLPVSIGHRCDDFRENGKRFHWIGLVGLLLNLSRSRGRCQPCPRLADYHSGGYRWSGTPPKGLTPPADRAGCHLISMDLSTLGGDDVGRHSPVNKHRGAGSAILKLIRLPQPLEFFGGKVWAWGDWQVSHWWVPLVGCLWIIAWKGGEPLRSRWGSLPVLRRILLWFERSARG